MVNTKHVFHLVDPSPWPLTGSIGRLLFVTGIARRIHILDFKIKYIGLLLIFITTLLWWRDVSREATLQGKHTKRVERGLRLGILLFIIREVCLFLSFFWSFFHSSLSPNVEVGARWPPIRINPMNPYVVPLLNTTVLLTRGATITWTHIALLKSDWLETYIGFATTVGLGLFFTFLQITEYINRNFTIADSVYGRTFYIATGFHGLHVLIGTLFIRAIWLRHSMGHFSESHHLGIETRAWYWHFVDVVWLFLFLCIYWWRY